MIGVAYDLENFPNYFSCCAVSLDRDDVFTWEISTRRNDAASFYSWLQYMAQNRIDMIGFNNLKYDYHLIHLFMNNPGLPVEQMLDLLFRKTKELIPDVQRQDNDWGPTIWENQRYIPQVDLLKVHHFDNKAKYCGLKQIQCTMRSDSVEDMPVKPGTYLTFEEMDIVRDYGEHDTLETKAFALHSKDQINFRRDLMNSATEPLRGDVMNFNDTKIGKQYLIQQLGENVCYEKVNGKRRERQTIRSEIRLRDIIYPYISFEQPEFQRVLAWMKEQVLTAEDIADVGDDTPAKVQTKGAFKDVHAIIDGFRFDFGTGGIHGSLERALIVADDQWRIGDVDVTSLYPSIAIVNRNYPQHLGEAFVDKYSDVKKRRLTFAKKTPPNEMMKLGLNGVYGDSNNPYSCFLDSQYTMTITINGQLLLCMLAERLMTVPTLSIIQINTDGITFRVHRAFDWMVEKVCKEWEKATWLDLETVDYSRMWIRDVNNYIAEAAKDKKTKMKGAYLYPETIKDYAGWWHKDYSSLVVQRAAHAYMVHGVPVRQFVHMHGDPFDFMLRAKVPRGSTLRIGEREVQRITRYYIAKNGGPLTKLSPPIEGSTPGQFKRGSKVSMVDYLLVMAEIGPDVWDSRIHTKNKSKYDERIMSFHAGWTVAECNRAKDFDWSNVNFEWYIAEAEKLIIR